MTSSVEEAKLGLCPITGISKHRLRYGDFCGECWATLSPYQNGCDDHGCPLRKVPASPTPKDGDDVNGQ